MRQFREKKNLIIGRSTADWYQIVKTTILDPLHPDSMKVVTSRIRYNTGYASNQVQTGCHNTHHFSFDRIELLNIWSIV